jgi:hypothetical protein
VPTTFVIVISRQVPLLVRVLAVVLALLQSATPAFAAVADGLLAQRDGGRPAVVHVEDRQQPNCQPVHPADCALCQFLTLAAEPVSLGAPFVAAAARPALPPAPEGARPSVARALHSARAPPGC